MDDKGNLDIKAGSFVDSDGITVEGSVRINGQSVRLNS